MGVEYFSVTIVEYLRIFLDPSLRTADTTINLVWILERKLMKSKMNWHKFELDFLDIGFINCTWYVRLHS